MTEPEQVEPMSIQEFLAIDAPDGSSTADLQTRIVAVLSDERLQDRQIEYLIGILAQACFDLEIRNLGLEAMIRNSHADSTELRAYVLDLETRILESGMNIGVPSFQLSPVQEL